MWVLALLILMQRAETTLDKQELWQKMCVWACVCVCVHVHFCVFTFTSPSVCAWKCVPRIVCLYKQMDENLRLLRSLSLRLSFFFFFLSHSRLVRAAQRRLCPFHQKDFPPSDSECASSSSSNCHRFFVNWDDVQLSGKKKKKQQSRVCFFLFPLPSLLLFLPAWFGFAYYPRHDGESVQNTEGSSSNKLKSFVRLFK